MIDDGGRSRATIGSGLDPQDAGRIAGREGVRSLEQADIMSHAIRVGNPACAIV